MKNRSEIVPPGVSALQLHRFSRLVGNPVREFGQLLHRLGALISTRTMRDHSEPQQTQLEPQGIIQGFV